MDIPEILREGEKHLPLAEHMTGEDAIALANVFYQTKLQADDFLEAQAIVVDGRVQLDLVGKEDGELVIHFVNNARPAVETARGLFNPLVQATAEHSWMAPQLRLVDASEMAFLDDLGSGNIAPLSGGADSAYKLAQLLNSNNLLGGWTSGTMGDRCTGGFQLVYKGWSIDAPDGFLLDYASEVAIIKINHGTEQGYLCLAS
ncbi:hypothetical protein D3C81_479430 [compost metagenome]